MIKALLVETEPRASITARDILAREGITVRTAADAEQALAILNDDREWDVLLTEAGPSGDLDGRQLARVAALLVDNLRIVFTGASPETAPGLGRRERFLKKPYSSNDLARVLRSLGIVFGSVSEQCGDA
jgi:DNA-binding response OmpR family regulator